MSFAVSTTHSRAVYPAGFSHLLCVSVLQALSLSAFSPRRPLRVWGHTCPSGVGGTGPCLPLVWSEVLVPGLLEGRLVLRVEDWPVFWSDASPHGAWKLGHGLCHPSAIPAPIKGYLGPLPLPRLPSPPWGVPQLPLPRAEVCL